MNKIISDFLDNTAGLLLAILAIAILATPIILIQSISRKESRGNNIKKYFRILIEFIKKILG